MKTRLLLRERGLSDRTSFYAAKRYLRTFLMAEVAMDSNEPVISPCNGYEENVNRGP